MSRPRTATLQEVPNSRWTRTNVTLLIGAAILAGMLSAAIQEFGVWQTTSPELASIRHLAQWNANFMQRPSENRKNESTRI